MKKKTLALTALAALALPAAAVDANKPAEPGKQGREKAAQKKAAQKPKGKAFTLKGTTSETALPVAEDKLTGPLTLDPTSANKHARTALTLTKADIRGTATETFGVAGDEVVVKYEGLTATDALTATDVVKVHGKVQRDGTLDIRRIQVVRETDES
jgi:opacity protein-like surface antigen